jgi:hypothetical protein
MKEILKTTVSLKDKQAFEAKAQGDGKTPAAALRDIAFEYAHGLAPIKQFQSPIGGPDIVSLSDEKAARHFVQKLDEFGQEIAALTKGIAGVGPAVTRGMTDNSRALAAVGRDIRAHAPVLERLTTLDKAVATLAKSIGAAVSGQLGIFAETETKARAAASAELTGLKQMIVARFSPGWVLIVPAVTGALAVVLLLALLPANWAITHHFAASILGERTNRFAAAGTLLGDSDRHQSAVFAQTAAALTDANFARQYDACLGRARQVKAGRTACTLDIPALGTR